MMKYKIVVAIGFIAGLTLGTVSAKELATVNGVTIDEDTVNRMIVNSQARSIPNMSREEALLTLIRQEVMLQKARELKINERPQVKKQLAELEKQLYVQSMLEELTNKIKISDAEYKELYDEQKKSMTGVQYQASHILVKDEKAAKEVITKLDKGGTFAKLAKELSIGPSSSVGGELGWFVPQRMDQDFIAGLKKLKKGEYSKEPVKSQFGYHIILFTDSKNIEPPKLEAIKPQLRSQILQTKIVEEVDKLVAKAKVVKKKIWFENAP